MLRSENDNARNSGYAIAEDDSIIVLVLPKPQKPYSELSDRSQRRKSNRLHDVLGILGMSLGEGFASLCDRWIRKGEKSEVGVESG